MRVRGQGSPGKECLGEGGDGAESPGKGGPGDRPGKEDPLKGQYSPLEGNIRECNSIFNIFIVSKQYFLCISGCF